MKDEFYLCKSLKLVMKLHVTRTKMYTYKSCMNSNHLQMLRQNIGQGIMKHEADIESMKCERIKSRHPVQHKS